MGRRGVGGDGGGLSRGGRKRGVRAALEAEIAGEIDALIGPRTVAGLDFEAIETAARRQALLIAARAVQRRLNDDESDHAGPAMSCACGGSARYAGRREKVVTTVLGPLRLSRAYYHCAACGEGFYPRDREMGIENASLSPALVRMTGLVGSMVSFVEGHTLLKELAGVAVDPKRVERTAEALGAEVAADERRVVESDPPSAPTMYLGMDGTGVPMRREEIAGRKGKQEDGSAKTREAKLVTVWTAEGRDKEGIPVRDPGSVSYSAAIESAAQKDTDPAPSDFARRAIREARRRGFDRAKRRVVLGDGAPWIWNLADEHLPGAVQIVDLYHAKGALTEVARAVYGPTGDLGAAWAKQRRDELEAGKLSALREALAVHAERHDKARQCLDYLHRNRRRLRYPYFRAQGLCVSTGVVEAGCKTVVGARLKRAGMRWTLPGADAILALRCSILSGRFEDFWERRAAAGGTG